MKKILSVILVFVMVLTFFSGCADKKTDSEPETSPEETVMTPDASASASQTASDVTDLPVEETAVIQSAENTDKATATASQNTPAPASIWPKFEDNYKNTAAYKISNLGGIDTLGRVVSPSDTTAKKGKYVGLFYFLCNGEHGYGTRDNSIISAVPGATESDKAWRAAGGGSVGAIHYWGKPMFGYYRSTDKWVMRKHIQMIADADVDFVFFDCSNGYTYTDNALQFLEISNELGKQGFDVPKVVFMLKWGDYNAAFNEVYTKVYQAHPEYSHLWFNWNGKPLIAFNENRSALTEEMKNFFTIKTASWPQMARTDDGFPWMEFNRILTKDSVYGENGRKEFMSVSVAQQRLWGYISRAAWYGKVDATRSYHNGGLDPAPDAYLYGYNIQEQFDYALTMDPECITITGWNEWTAQRQPFEDDIDVQDVIRFVDNANMEASRDIEPMEGGFGDNYYIQMISNIKKFKGTNGKAPVTKKTMKLGADFSQWNDVASYYKDYTEDTVARDEKNMYTKKELNRYTDTTGRNDIYEMKIAEDDANMYFFVTTKNTMTAPAGDNWMNLFIGTDIKNGWNGYNYVLNYKQGTAEKLYLGKLSKGADFKVTPVCDVQYRMNKNYLMVQIPKAALGIKGDASFMFKWSDNCTLGDVFSFYKNGDAAPIGRMGYYYGK